MIKKFYAIHEEFSQLSFDVDIVDEVFMLSDKQIQRVFHSFDEKSIVNHAKTFLGNIEKSGDFLTYQHELFPSVCKIKVEDHYIEIYDDKDNIFLTLLNRMFRNTLLIDEK